MNQKSFCLIGGIVFSVVALLHLARIAFGWDAVIAGWPVPEWVSWLAVLVAGFLGYKGIKLGIQANGL